MTAAKKPEADDPETASHSAEPDAETESTVFVETATEVVDVAENSDAQPVAPPSRPPYAPPPPHPDDEGFPHISKFEWENHDFNDHPAKISCLIDAICWHQRNLVAEHVLDVKGHEAVLVVRPDDTHHFSTGDGVDSAVVGDCFRDREGRKRRLDRGRAISMNMLLAALCRYRFCMKGRENKREVYTKINGLPYCVVINKSGSKFYIVTAYYMEQSMFNKLEAKPQSEMGRFPW